jgi:hypothetical protein
VRVNRWIRQVLFCDSTTVMMHPWNEIQTLLHKKASTNPKMRLHMSMGKGANEECWEKKKKNQRAEWPVTMRNLVKFSAGKPAQQMALQINPRAEGMPGSNRQEPRHNYSL